MRASRSPARAEATSAPATRGLIVRLGLYWGTLFVLTVGSCTLTFWILATTTRILTLGPTELFVIRAVGLIALALAAAGIFFIAGTLRRMTLPIREMMESAERIAQGDYSAQVREQGPRELRSLARSFNHMAGQLQANASARRTLVANIANELRTPLTMLQENIEGLLGGNFARDDAHLNLILGETIRLSTLVQEMRMLALAESGGLILQREATDLSALVNETVELYHRSASARHIGLHAVLPAVAPIADVDPARLQQALGHLIEDALRANLKSDIRVELSALPTEHAAPAQAQIEVAYRATVLPAQQLAGYFDRFYGEPPRAPSEESGLGLAITKLLVQAHGGTLSIHSEARSGTQVRVRVPVTGAG